MRPRWRFSQSDFSAEPPRPRRASDCNDSGRGDLHQVTERGLHHALDDGRRAGTSKVHRAQCSSERRWLRSDERHCDGHPDGTLSAGDPVATTLRSSSPRRQAARRCRRRRSPALCRTSPRATGSDDRPVLRLERRRTLRRRRDARSRDSRRFKERANDNGAAEPQSRHSSSERATRSSSRSDFSQSVAFLGGRRGLEDASRPPRPVERVPRPVVAAVPGGFQLATLEEFSSGDTGYFCPTGFACFGQSVATSAPGIFSAIEPGEPRHDDGPGAASEGVTEKSLRVHHDAARRSRPRAAGALLQHAERRSPAGAW